MNEGDGELWSKDIHEIVRKYALQNALEYDGKGKPGSVMGRIMSERKDLRHKAKELKKFVENEVFDANKLAEENGVDVIKKILIELDPEALVRKKQVKRFGLPDLEVQKNTQVILRFAPNPNGPLTLGHSRGIVINSQLALKYNGKVVLRFDDTDTKVKPPMMDAYNWIEEEYHWVSGVKPDLVIRASERMPIYLKYAKEMIEKGFGYVCRCSASEFKILRDSSLPSPYRDRSVNENLIDWEKMLSGEMKEGEGVVRVKTSIDLPNPALRDWPALRIQHHPHPIVGKKYKVWPLLDFQSAVEDHEQKVTHIIRGKDLMDSTRKQKLLYKHFDWEYPKTLYWGRVKVFEFGGFSTSGMKQSIENKDYEGWDDLRLPTIKSLKRRGFIPKAIRDFWIDLGLSQKDISISMQTIESFNSKNIDSTSPRRFFIKEPVEIKPVWTEENINILNSIKFPNHPEKDKIDGFRKWAIKDSSEVIFIEKSDFGTTSKLRLKDFADISIVDSIATIESIVRKDKRQIIHWLSNSMAIEAILYVPNGNNINKYVGLIENFELVEGGVYQFERVGFVKIEEIGDDGPIKLIWLHG